ncbi:MAG: vacuolar iron transporter family protein [Chloroflexota bacterium]|jgi:VIT1/CCC1 family predicted Fe2+/Mn2+ transporter|nr:vacuolar iron transporter family protein [Chloroflexota bacterium]
MTSPTLQLTAAERATSLANLKLERDAINLYDSLAAMEKNPDRARVFERIAKNERRHAEIWATRLEQAGATVPQLSGPRLRVRLVILLARLFGPERVADLVRGLEGDEEAAYGSQMTPETEAIAADEREHAQMWDEITGSKGVGAGKGARKNGLAEEALHRGGRSGTLRAAVFGANDGLVSNLSLVMGVAGAVGDNHFIVLAGIAGLLAGAFSMAAGEYISMQSQREMFENQIAVEREEMRVMPEVEQEELAAIYRAKGVAPADAQRIAEQLMEDPVKALDTKVREELGLDPEQLGSSWGAAIYSFVFFAIGAVIPLGAFLVARGDVAFIAALVLSFAALFAVGAAVSIVTGKSMLYSGLRQVVIGAAAAAVTYGVGSVIGANVA